MPNGVDGKLEHPTEQSVQSRGVFNRPTVGLCEWEVRDTAQCSENGIKIVDTLVRYLRTIERLNNTFSCGSDMFEGVRATRFVFFFTICTFMNNLRACIFLFIGVAHKLSVVRLSVRFRSFDTPGV